MRFVLSGVVLLAALVAGFRGQSYDQVVEVGEEFVGGEVDVGEGAYGGAQPAHGGRGLDAVADDVPDDQGDPHPGQRDHVEPVAADPGPCRRQIATFSTNS